MSQANERRDVEAREQAQRFEQPPVVLSLTVRRDHALRFTEGALMTIGQQIDRHLGECNGQPVELTIRFPKVE